MGVFHLLVGGVLFSVIAFGSCHIELAHQAITTDLFNGRPVWGHPISRDGNNHSLWLIGLYNDQTQRERTAFFKPRVWGDEDGWSRTPMEYVAYALNRKLWMDYVPPTAYRRNLTVSGHFFSEGAVLFEVPNTRTLFDVPDEHWGMSRRGTLSDHRILCVLLENGDGHYKNLLVGNHWTDGKWKPVFIDFGASLRAGTLVTMTHYPAFRNSDPVDFVRRQTLDRLRALRWEDLLEWSEFLSHDEVRGILARRDGIVRYFDWLVSERGEGAVFVP